MISFNNHRNGIAFYIHTGSAGGLRNFINKENATCVPDELSNVTARLSGDIDVNIELVRLNSSSVTVIYGSYVTHDRSTAVFLLQPARSIITFLNIIMHKHVQKL